MRHTAVWERSVVSIVAGAIGASLVPSHPVLAFLNTAALAGNTHAVLKKERTVKDAAKRLGQHLVATAGSLAMPSYPAIGYVAGAIAADLLIDGKGGGIVEEMMPDVIDAEIVEERPAPKTTALVQVER